MGILSIQSHVVYGYVGNKAATYPLQSMGYDVWPVNTVQFSSHTGYNNWQGDVFSREHIKKIINAIEDLGVINQCKAILSGYMGSSDICLEVSETAQRFKALNNKVVYLCDPVMGNNSCFVKPEVVDFFKKSLKADIITPNQFEAEMLSGIQIKTAKDLQNIAEYFHELGILIVVITGIKINHSNTFVFISDGQHQHIIPNKEYHFEVPINGTGDLFSAIFLGSYLVNYDALQAAKNSIYYMNKVVENTMIAQTRELQVLSTNYNSSPKDIISMPLSSFSGIEIKLV